MRVLPLCNRPGRQLSIWKAILVGQVVVNVPTVGIMMASLFLGATVVPWQLSAILGSILGWVWWSYTVPRWRDWALYRGLDPDRLQKFAFRTSLTWPRGSLFEKTEFRRRK